MSGQIGSHVGKDVAQQAISPGQHRFSALREKCGDPYAADFTVRCGVRVWPRGEGGGLGGCRVCAGQRRARPAACCLRVSTSWQYGQAAMSRPRSTAWARVRPVAATPSGWCASVAVPVQPGCWIWQRWPASSRQSLRARRVARVEPWPVVRPFHGWSWSSQYRWLPTMSSSQSRAGHWRGARGISRPHCRRLAAWSVCECRRAQGFDRQFVEHSTVTFSAITGRCRSLLDSPHFEA